MNKEKPNLPIIILNWNGSSDTIECIDSVFQSDHHDFMIYLIDNGSEYKEYEKLHSLYHDSPRVKLIRYKTNLGFAKAHNKIWNEVLSLMDFPYLFLLNNDTVISSRCLSEIIKCIAENTYDAIACKMIDYYNRDTVDNNGLRVLSNGEILPLQHNQSTNDELDHEHFIGPSGGAAIYKSSMLKNLGFFDSWFDTGYEDAEFTMRALLSNYTFGYTENAVVYHKGSNSIKKMRDKAFIRRAQRNILYTNFKLLPIGNLILSLLIGTIRTIMILLVSLFSLRWNYISILLGSRLEFYSSDIKKALQARRAITRTNSNAFRKKSSSIIRNDLQRFKEVFLRGNSSALDI